MIAIKPQAGVSARVKTTCYCPNLKDKLLKDIPGLEGAKEMMDGAEQGGAGQGGVGQGGS